ADLTQACNLDPSQADYFYQRARAYAAEKQGTPARTDLDQALKLKPDFVDALIMRAQFELSQKDLQGARTDLDTVDRSAPNESDVRFALASLYLSDRAPDVSVHQLNSWIAVHPQDFKLPDALNLRCFARAMGNIELEEAQSDCTAALRKAPNTAA